MKHYTGYHYELRHINNNGGLADVYETIEAAMAGREAARQRQIALGYSPESFIIVRVMWQRVFTDNGEFLAETTSISKV